MPKSAPSALHKALRDSRIVGPARDARRVIFCDVHGQGRGNSPAVSSAQEAVGDDQLQHGGLYHSQTRAELSLACNSPTSALPLAYSLLSRRYCFGDISRFHAVAVPTESATDFCGPNPQCGPQSHIVGTRHNALPHDELALWSYPL